MFLSRERPGHLGRETRMGNYLTTSEVASILRAPEATVRYWRHLGTGPQSFKVGRRVLYDRADVEAFIAKARADAEVARAC
jgi:excisionase family DNA binding protein